MQWDNIFFLGPYVSEASKPYYQTGGEIMHLKVGSESETVIRKGRNGLMIRFCTEPV